MKVNAARLGIELIDRTSSTRRCSGRRDGQAPVHADGRPWTTAAVCRDPPTANDPFVRDGAGNVLHTNQAFLIDINPAADPNFHCDDGTNDPPLGYDAALLASHFVSGDHRVNENDGDRGAPRLP